MPSDDSCGSQASRAKGLSDSSPRQSGTPLHSKRWKVTQVEREINADADN